MPMDDTQQWWNRRRLRYNGLAIAIGFLCFVAWVVLGMTLPPPPEVGAELTLITLPLMAIGVTMYLAVANVAYRLGARMERRARPADVPRFRARLFAAGVALTVLPFVAVPVLTLAVWGYGRATAPAPAPCVMQLVNLVTGRVTCGGYE